DLVQFLYAVDRGNPRVSTRFDPLSAPVLRALKDIAEKSRVYGKPATVCGELASQPIGALALTALGYRSLSLTPSAVGPVKAMLPDQKLNALVASHAVLERELAAAVPPETYVKLSREFAELAPVVEAVKFYRAAEHELEGVTSLIADPATDPEMRSIAEAEKP